MRFRGADPAAVLAALEAYRNTDGGYGAIEPDLRAVESQPVGAMHAFEVFEDVAPGTTPRAAELCDWLGEVCLPDGGLPFALPVADATATAERRLADIRFLPVGPSLDVARRRASRFVSPG